MPRILVLGAGVAGLEVAQLEGGLAALQEETTKALANKAEKRIEKMTEKVFEDVQMLERNEAQLREHTKALEDDYAAGAAASSGAWSCTLTISYHEPGGHARKTALPTPRAASGSSARTSSVTS